MLYMFPYKTINDNTINIKDISTIKPTLEIICNYSKEINSTNCPEAFYYYYESIGWLINDKPIKNWKSVYRSWGKDLMQEPKIELLLEDMYEKMHLENNYGIDAKYL